MANYKISDRWKVSLGPYVSYMTEGNFSGHVYKGHLRTPDETGQRVDFTGESIATYDFSDNLRKFQWGAQLGGEWKAFKHLNVYADLTWGLNDIFKKDFDTITFVLNKLDILKTKEVAKNRFTDFFATSFIGFSWILLNYPLLFASLL